MTTSKTEAPKADNITVTEDTLQAELSDGRTISIPLVWYPRLVHATQAERDNWELIGDGEGIRWPDLDENLSIEGLIAGRMSGESQRSLNRWLKAKRVSRSVALHNLTRVERNGDRKIRSILRGIISSRHNILNRIMERWYGVAAVAAGFAFLATLLSTPTQEDPTGGAGLFAPVVALCVAAMVLAEAIRAGGLQIRRAPGIFIGLGSMASAYLWMADAGETHPREPVLLGTLALLFVMGAILAVPVIALFVKSQPNNKSSSD